MKSKNKRNIKPNVFLKINPFYFVAAALLFAGLGIFMSKPTLTGYAVSDIEDSIQRSFVCEWCNENFIPGDTDVTIVLKIDLEEGSKRVIEYFPGEWSLLDAGEGHVSVIDDEYYKIEWNAEGGLFEKEYSVRLPVDTLNPRFEVEIK